jgi:lysozyme
MDHALAASEMRRLSVVGAVCALLTGAMSAVGCSSSDPAPSDGCVGSGSAELKTCAKGATITGVDVSIYQGNVNWTQIKGSGRQFAFARISDGLNSPDSKFAQNWPAMKAAGIVRGSYQFFRPSQDPAAQAQMVIDKLAAAGGLKPGDLPPVLDLESADGLASSVVIAKAKTWLTKVEAATKVKPIVYTAAFMSSVIGTGFGGYTLWVANYGTTCPTMPSGWTNWHFWQNSDNGNVPGISGNVDTDFFNGTLPQLQALTIKAATPPPHTGGPGDVTVTPDTHGTAGGNKPNDGSEGATLGSGTPTEETTGAPITPCQ